jgi:Protein of unknown function (DUF3606)
MFRRPTKPLRSRLDLNDPVQVRLLRKRLRVSEEQLGQLVQTVGTGIAAITKEARHQAGIVPAEMESAPIIAAVGGPNPAEENLETAAAP